MTIEKTIQVCQLKQISNNKVVLLFKSISKMSKNTGGIWARLQQMTRPLYLSFALK